MTKTRKIIYGTALTGAILLGVSVFAYQGNPGVANPDCTDPDRYEAVQQVFETKDYSEFQTLYEGKGVLRKIDTKEKFEKFVDMRDAYEAGETKTYETLKTELGLGQRKQDGSGYKNGNRRGNGKGLRDGSGQGQGQGRGRNQTNNN